ncbi:BED-type domain-containing protein [Heracleum sosnowskyi]|uniref:BED-type domain-containing protein n=1 Tax=Heracleum sosnowskyi TaxID=360622 RepID=A0AAD8J2R9_9APIA|nr:BED-type domain-containing protein [Heracleum sosnowskyi]
MVDLCDTEVDGNEVHSDGDSIAPMTSAPLQPIQKPDGRRSNCWTVFGMIDGPNVDPLLRRARCIYCKKATLLAKSSNGTSNMNKHMKKCKPYIEFLKTTGAIPQFTQTRYRELVSKAIVRHVYAFSWVEHKGNGEIHAYLNHEVQSLKLCFEKLYNDQDAIIEVANVMFKLKKLFVEYMPKGRNNSTEVSSSTSDARTSKRPKFNLVDLETEDLSDVSIKSKLDLYLEEPRLNRDAELNILEFWGKNESKYVELSYMAVDILSVPLTTVASESTFSIGGRILNKWRSSYLPENVEVLITTRSWLHGYEVQVMDKVECIGCEVEWATKE